MGDVAALAGVSQMTVSRVMNGRPGVRNETRDRVLAAIKELDYRPNIAARSLVTGRTNTVGVISFDTTLYGPASTLHAVQVAAREAGYLVSVALLRSLEPESLADAMARLWEQAVDGVLVIAPHESVRTNLQNLSSELPVVALEGGGDGATPAVAVDQRDGAARATRHLLELGHETVWHVAGPDDWLEARGRLEAWRATLVEAGRPVPPVLTGNWSARSGYEHGRTISATPEVTAVFAANDQMALGILRALREAGRAVPDDVSIVGFDDVPEAAFFSPPLTTVRQPFGDVGRRGLEVLLAQVEGSAEVATPIAIRPELVLRSSTAPARTARRR